MQIFRSSIQDDFSHFCARPRTHTRLKESTYVEICRDMFSKKKKSRFVHSCPPPWTCRLSSTLWLLSNVSPAKHVEKPWVAWAVWTLLHQNKMSLKKDMRPSTLPRFWFLSFFFHDIPSKSTRGTPGIQFIVDSVQNFLISWHVSCLVLNALHKRREAVLNHGLEVWKVLQTRLSRICGRKQLIQSASTRSTTSRILLSPVQATKFPRHSNALSFTWQTIHKELFSKPKQALQRALQPVLAINVMCLCMC